MLDGLRRDLILAASAVVVLVTALVIESKLHALLIAIAAVFPCAGVSWVRSAHYLRLKHRLAGAATSGFVGAALAFLVVATVGAVVSVLGAAVVLLGVALIERARLRGTAVPMEGEASGRVAFEGTVHAIGDPVQVPGSDYEVAVWLARHGRKRWTSTPRFEVRSDARRVLVEPGSSKLRGDAWVKGGSSGEAAVRAVGGEVTDSPTYADPVRVWSFRDGDRVYVIGTATLEDDPAAPTLRDPARISVFTGTTLVGPGRLAPARRVADLRALLWGAVAISAGVLMAAGLGSLG